MYDARTASDIILLFIGSLQLPKINEGTRTAL